MLQNYLTFQVLIKLKLLGSIHKNWSPNLRNIPSAVSEGAEACVLFPWHRDPAGCEWHRYSSWGALLWAGEASPSWHSAQAGRRRAGAHGSRWVEKKYPSVQGRRWAWACPHSWFSWAGGNGCLWQNSVCQLFSCAAQAVKYFCGVLLLILVAAVFQCVIRWTNIVYKKGVQTEMWRGKPYLVMTGMSLQSSWEERRICALPKNCHWRSPKEWQRLENS